VTRNLTNKQCRIETGRANAVAVRAIAEAPSHKTWLALKRAPEQAGIQFIDENGGGPGLRLCKKQ
jgi:hypothetical protein